MSSPKRPQRTDSRRLCAPSNEPQTRPHEPRNGFANRRTAGPKNSIPRAAICGCHISHGLPDAGTDYKQNSVKSSGHKCCGAIEPGADQVAPVSADNSCPDQATLDNVQRTARHTAICGNFRQARRARHSRSGCGCPHHLLDGQRHFANPNSRLPHMGCVGGHRTLQWSDRFSQPGWMSSIDPINRVSGHRRWTLFASCRRPSLR